MRKIIKLSQPDFLMITCEHGGNRIPSRYQGLFTGRETLLRTHRGYDPGALRMARDMSAALSGSLVASTVSRLVIDLNRSPGHPRLYSEATRLAAPEVRQDIFRRCYLPYRTRAEARIAGAIADGARVIHISCHSFTPELDGEVRKADIGLLYDPARKAEAGLCRRWQTALQECADDLRVRMNYPYAGTADGFTTHLRRRFAGDSYLGIELEINQKHVFPSVRRWRELRRAVIHALHEALHPENAMPNLRASNDAHGGTRLARVEHP